MANSGKMNTDERHPAVGDEEPIEHHLKMGVRNYLDTLISSVTYDKCVWVGTLLKPGISDVKDNVYVAREARHGRRWRLLSQMGDSMENTPWTVQNDVELDGQVHEAGTTMIGRRLGYRSEVFKLLHGEIEVQEEEKVAREQKVAQDGGRLGDIEKRLAKLEEEIKCLGQKLQAEVTSLSLKREEMRATHLARDNKVHAALEEGRREREVLRRDVKLQAIFADSNNQRQRELEKRLDGFLEEQKRKEEELAYTVKNVNKARERLLAREEEKTMQVQEFQARLEQEQTSGTLPWDDHTLRRDAEHAQFNFERAQARGVQWERWGLPAQTKTLEEAMEAVGIAKEPGEEEFEEVPPARA